MASVTNINMDFNTQVTQNFVEKTAKENFPDCKVKVWSNYVSIKESNCVLVRVFIRQKKNKNLTTLRLVPDVSLGGMFVPLLIFTSPILAPIIASIAGNSRRKVLRDHVEDVMRDALRNKLGIEAK